MENKKEKSNEIKIPEDLIINPDGTAIFTLNDVGDVLGAYKGTFVFKCYLNPLEALGASRLHRELIGPNPQDASEGDQFLAFCLSQLSKRILKAPPFWNTGDMIAGNIPDLNILSTILQKAIDSESLYKARLKEKKAESLEKAKNAIAGTLERLNGIPDKE